VAAVGRPRIVGGKSWGHTFIKGLKKHRDSRDLANKIKNLRLSVSLTEVEDSAYTAWTVGSSSKGGSHRRGQ